MLVLLALLVKARVKHRGGENCHEGDKRGVGKEGESSLTEQTSAKTNPFNIHVLPWRARGQVLLPIQLQGKVVKEHRSLHECGVCCMKTY